MGKVLAPEKSLNNNCKDNGQRSNSIIVNSNVSYCHTSSNLAEEDIHQFFHYVG